MLRAAASAHFGCERAADATYDAYSGCREQAIWARRQWPAWPAPLNRGGTLDGYFAIEFHETVPLRPVGVIEVLSKRPEASTWQTIKPALRLQIPFAASRCCGGRKDQIIFCEFCEPVRCHVRVSSEPSIAITVKATVNRKRDGPRDRRYYARYPDSGGRQSGSAESKSVPAARRTLNIHAEAVVRLPAEYRQLSVRIENYSGSVRQTSPETCPARP